MRPYPCPPETTTRHRIMVIDAAPLWGLGMSGLLGGEPDLEWCGHIRGADELHEVERVRPHVVTLEIGEQPRAGLRLIQRIRSAFPDMRVVVISGQNPAQYADRAIRAGASGFLLKDVTAEWLFEAVRVVAVGEALLAPGVTRRLISEFARLRPQAVTGGPTAGGWATSRLSPDCHQDRD